MNNEIYLKSKTVYGKNLIYPDCDTARIFLNLTHSKTFSDLILIEAVQCIPDLYIAGICINACPSDPIATPHAGP